MAKEKLYDVGQQKADLYTTNPTTTEKPVTKTDLPVATDSEIPKASTWNWVPYKDQTFENPIFDLANNNPVPETPESGTEEEIPKGEEAPVEFDFNDLFSEYDYTPSQPPQEPQISEDAKAIYKAIWDLNYALQGVDAKVSSTFTGEVPDYITTAYANNQKAYLLRQMDRYKYMAEAYKQEHNEKMDIYDRQYRAWYDQESLRMTEAERQRNNAIALYNSATGWNSGVVGGQQSVLPWESYSAIETRNPLLASNLSSIFSGMADDSLSDWLKTGAERQELLDNLWVDLPTLMRLRKEYNLKKLATPNENTIEAVKVLNQIMNQQGMGIADLAEATKANQKAEYKWRDEQWKKHTTSVTKDSIIYAAETAIQNAIQNNTNFNEEFDKQLEKKYTVELLATRGNPATKHFDTDTLHTINHFVGALQTLRANNFLAVINSDDLSLARITDMEGRIINNSIMANNVLMYTRGTNAERKQTEASKITGWSLPNINYKAADNISKLYEEFVLWKKTASSLQNQQSSWAGSPVLPIVITD